MKDKRYERDYVKEYRLKKSRSLSSRPQDIIAIPPVNSSIQRLGAEDGDDARIDGIMMTTAEILDFSEGTDSQVGGH